MNNISNIKNKSKSKVLTPEEYDALRREIIYYKKTIEELQDELDSIEAEKIKKESKGTIKFHLEDYVSDRDRINSSKSIKKNFHNQTGKESQNL